MLAPSAILLRGGGSNLWGLQIARSTWGPEGSRQGQIPCIPPLPVNYPMARLQTRDSHNRIQKSPEMRKFLCLLWAVAIPVAGCFGGSGSNVDCSQSLEAVCGALPDPSNETAMNEWMDCASSYTAQCPPRGLDAYPFPCFFAPAVVMAISLLVFRRRDVFRLLQE